MLPASAVRQRVIWLVVIVLACLAVVPAGASADADVQQGDAPPVVMAGTTTVRGAASASMVVTVPSPARISATVVDNPDVTVDGDARYAGVALVSTTATGDHQPTVVAGRVARDAVCDGTRCPYGVATSVSALAMELRGNDVLVPAGTYRLHLIVDGANAEVAVRLNLRGLDGAIALTPADPTRATTIALTPDELPSHNVYWGTGRHDLGREHGLMWSMVWSHEPVNHQREFHYCAFAGTDPGDHPGCVAPTAQVRHLGNIVGAEFWTLAEGFTYPASADTAQKMWWAGGVSENVDGVAVWLPFGEPQAALPPLEALLRVTFFPVALAGGDAVTSHVSTSCDAMHCSQVVATAPARSGS